MSLTDRWLSRCRQICNRFSTICLECSEEVMRRRLEQRAKSSERIDDNPDTVSKRIQTFKENRALVIAHLRERGSVCHVSKQSTSHLNLISMQDLGQLQRFH